MESSAQIVAHLVAIKWLLVFIAAGMGMLVVTFLVLATHMVAVLRENRRSNSSAAKQSELEELLAAGQNRAAKHTALEWVSAEPGRSEAHWALAKAHYQLGELAEAKQVLKALLRISPEEHYRVDAWLELLENEFALKRPKPVE
jgi:tetratricopeptide (TPR) repeat protein